MNAHTSILLDIFTARLELGGFDLTGQLSTVDDGVALTFTNSTTGASLELVVEDGDEWFGWSVDNGAWSGNDPISAEALTSLAERMEAQPEELA